MILHYQTVNNPTLHACMHDFTLLNHKYSINPTIFEKSNINPTMTGSDLGSKHTTSKLRKREKKSITRGGRQAAGREVRGVEAYSRQRF